MKIWNLSNKILLSNTSTNSIAIYNTKISIIGLVLAISALILTTSFSKGYRQHLVQSMSNIFGHAYIEKFSISYESSTTSKVYMNSSDIDFIRKKLGNDKIKSLYGFTNENSVVYKAKYYSGVVHNKIFTDNLDDDFHFKSFIKRGENFSFNENYLCIGESLARKIGVDTSDYVSVLDVSNNKSISIYASNFLVGSIYQTNLFDYDDKLVFSVVLDNNESNIFNAAVMQLSNPKDIDNINNFLNSDDGYIYKINTWDQEFYRQISWLNQFEAPIKIIMYFILLVALFHMLSSFYILLKEQEKTISLLIAIGFSKMHLYLIFLVRSLYLSGLSILIATLFALLIMHLQETYQLISIPESIYFTSHLPVCWDFSFFIYYASLAFCGVLVSTFFVIPKLFTINIVKVLNNA